MAEQPPFVSVVNQAGDVVAAAADLATTLATSGHDELVANYHDILAQTARAVEDMEAVEGRKSQEFSARQLDTLSLASTGVVRRLGEWGRAQQPPHHDYEGQMRAAAVAEYGPKVVSRVSGIFDFLGVNGANRARLEPHYLRFLPRE